MELKPGSRWKSAVCAAEVVVVRAPTGPLTLECGGTPMLPAGAERPEGAAAPVGEGPSALLGKRYADTESGLEALCAKGGAGALSVDGRPLLIKDPKKLPSSD